MGSVPDIKGGSAVRVYSRHGAEYTARLPGMVEAFSKLSARTTILDGELCLIDPKVGAHFYANARIRTRRSWRSSPQSQMRRL